MEKNRIKVKDLSICSEVYLATADEILIKPIINIELKEDGSVNVKSGKYSYEYFTAEKEDEVLKNDSYIFFLNYEDAVAEQRRLRKEKLEESEKVMDVAIARYRELLEMYTDVIDKSVEG